ncbi:MAG: LysM peptidoglycan-binding domain-containing protein [Lentisphaeria bacterium]|nr:LysM peptidoglycan-binding domain-containing protein [Lentisphaeria bacterium]
MRKIHLFAVAGAAVLLTGCPTTKPITNHKPIIPAPELDPAAVTAPEQTPAQNTAIMPPPPTPTFEPMTDVRSSGGVDSDKVPPKRKKSRTNAKKVAPVKGGNIYIVKSGDTPERIARRLRIRLSALMDANNLDQASARRLQIGQKLIIPSGAAVRKNAVKPNAKGKNVKKTVNNTAPANTSVGADGMYVVKSGDTPERIARRLRVRLSDLLNANNLDQASARRLQIGQKLVIPGKENTQVKPVVTPPGENNGGNGTEVPPAGNTGDNTNPPSNDNAGNNVPSPVDNTGADTTAPATSEPVLTEVTEDISLEDYAKKHNIDKDWLSKNNSGKTQFKNGDLIFTPAK